MKKYIKANTNKEETFVRFGKRFKHGKSINYLAMNPRIKQIYSEKLAELQYGYITEEEFDAWCEDALDSFVWGPSTSCFECDQRTKLPIVKNVSQAKTLIGFINRFENNLPCQAFIVKGTRVGTGTDTEPLVNITYEEPIEYDIDDLIDVVLNALSEGFKETQDISWWDGEVLYPSDEFIHVGFGAFQYKDKLFIGVKDSFIENYEYKGQVMDKLKFEKSVDIDYEDIVCIYISADKNGGKSELADMIYEWGGDVYTKPYYFENRYHILIKENPRKDYFDGDLYVVGNSADVDDFISEFPFDYDELQEDDIPSRLIEKFKTMKFYE